jgi:D-lactate dehydrogenase (cytochrome)
MTHDCSFIDDLNLEGRVETDPDHREAHSTDYGTTDSQGVAPDAVVYPASTADVSAVLAAANQRWVPVTPYAAGTSTEGNPVPVEGGISLDTTEMAGIHEVHPADFLVDCGPGTIGADLEDAVAEHGLMCPPFPQSAEISTVGGMIANDASGTRTVKYGEVADWVRRLEVVLADGTVTAVGSRAAKSSSGYNLRELFVGSEGTLGVITHATLALTNLPAETRAGRAVFAELDAAADAVAEVLRSGIDVATIELIDPDTAAISNAYTGADMPDGPMLFVEFHGHSAAGVEDDLDRWRALVTEHGADRVEIGEDDETMERLWRARREIGHALLDYDADLVPLAIGDVTVPIGRYPAILRFARSVADELDLLIPCFGHAGDGNLHYAVMVDRSNDGHVERGWDASDRIVRRALELGGTSTGEHGIGRGKLRYMRDEHGKAGLGAMRAVKDALDPNGILNPGKVLPEDLAA